MSIILTSPSGRHSSGKENLFIKTCFCLYTKLYVKHQSVSKACVEHTTLLCFEKTRIVEKNVITYMKKLLDSDWLRKECKNV